MSSRPVLQMSSAILAAIEYHAQEAFPNECCGLLGGCMKPDAYRVECVARMVNALASPTRFESEPRSLFAAKRLIESAGWEIVGIYHSHPTSAPIPSQHDLRHHYWGPNIVCVIHGIGPSLRAWWLHETGYEEAIIVSPDQPADAPIDQEK